MVYYSVNQAINACQKSVIATQNSVFTKCDINNTIRVKGYYIVPIPIPSCPGPALLKKKKEKKKKIITYLYQGSCLHILEAGNGLFAFK